MHSFHLLLRLLTTPKTAAIKDTQCGFKLFTRPSLPYIIPGTIVQLNAPIALLVALVAWLIFSRSVFGFQIRVVGTAPHAARHGGFSANGTIWLALLISGGLAGFAGVLEAMGPVGRLILQFPANYGFTAIIVAFLGRLHPLGVVLAGLASCLTAGVAAVAQARKVQLRSVSATLEAGMDVRGILGMDEDVRNGFDGIKVTYKIDADASPEDIKAIVAQSQKRSAVYDIITNPTNVTVEVT